MDVLRKIVFLAKSRPSLMQRQLVITQFTGCRQFNTTPIICQEIEEEEPLADENEGKVPIIDPQTSIRYMESKAYAETYGSEPVWTKYRRNHPGSYPPRKPRKTCIRAGKISAGNPCPICRDEYLVLHRENTKLLKQFISPLAGDILPTSKTNICERQFKNLLVAVEQAWDYGYIEKPLPSRTFDYSEYYPSLKEANNKKQ